MAYVKPTKEGIENAIEEGWSRDAAERGYDIFCYGYTDMLEINAIGDAYPSLKTEDGYDDEACAIEAERSGFCKIITVEELPVDFDRRYYGWVDTPENRKAIEEYVSMYCA